MIFEFIVKGIIIGFLSSLPVGPISILIIQRTIGNSRNSGFYSGIGAATSDTVYATVAGFSLSIIIDFIRVNEIYLKIGGSMVLILLGIVIFFNHPEKRIEKLNSKPNTLVKNIFTTFLLTFTNPLVVFLHIGIFTAFGVILHVARLNQAIFILAGFFVGAVFWWFILTGFVSLLKNRINTKIYFWFNKIAGAAIVIVVLVSLTIVLIRNIGI
ncbi:LysE family translocator [Maribellus comscasis]|nr:LysE family transporter [Maribellus comscasis]